MKSKIRHVSTLYNLYNIKTTCSSVLENMTFGKFAAYGYAHALNILDIMHVATSTVDILVSPAYIMPPKTASCFSRSDDATTLMQAFSTIATGSKKKIVSDDNTSHLFNYMYAYKQPEYYDDVMACQHTREKFYAALLACIITIKQLNVDITLGVDNVPIKTINLCAIVKRRNGNIGYISLENDVEIATMSNVSGPVYESYASTLSKDGNVVLIRMCLKRGFPGIFITIPINVRVATYLAILGIVFTSKPKYIELRSLRGSMQFVKADTANMEIYTVK
jgi:hypothetical protein